MAATVVSVCNFPIGPEFKPQLNPAHFSVPAATEDDLGILVVKDVLQYIPQLDYKTIVVGVPDKELANSIVEDWVGGQLQITAEARPGIFYVDGEYDSDEIKDEYDERLQSVVNAHTNWCQALLRMADDLWQVKKQHRHISSSMINAASYLQAEREWTRAPRPEDFKKCPACRIQLDQDAIICKGCRVIIDKAQFAALGLQLA